MIPTTVQKMIDDEAKKFYTNYILGPPSLDYNPHKCFKSGASFAFELGLSQGIEAVCEWLNTFGYTEDHMSNIADSIKQHFKDRGGE